MVGIPISWIGQRSLPTRWSVAHLIGHDSRVRRLLFLEVSGVLNPFGKHATATGPCSGYPAWTGTS